MKEFKNKIVKLLNNSILTYKIFQPIYIFLFVNLILISGCSSINKSVNINVVKQLRGIKADMTKEQLYNFILQAYPKVEGVSVEDHAANINNLIEEAYK